MKTQVLKMADNGKVFTVVFDDKREYPTQYAVYYHGWKLNKNGVYRKTRVLVDRVWNMQMALAWIQDILNGHTPDKIKGIV